MVYIVMVYIVMAHTCPLGPLCSDIVMAYIVMAHTCRAGPLCSDMCRGMSLWTDADMIKDHAHRRVVGGHVSGRQTLSRRCVAIDWLPLTVCACHACRHVDRRCGVDVVYGRRCRLLSTRRPATPAHLPRNIYLMRLQSMNKMLVAV